MQGICELNQLDVACYTYFPLDKDKPVKTNNFEISLTSIENKNSLYRETLIEIKDSITKESLHKVRHYYIYSWVDMSIIDPKKETLLMNLINYMTKSLNTSPSQPIVVHCSAGVGRTGTLISLYQLYQEYLQMKTLKTDFSYSIYDTILRLRHMRNHMVFTESQYEFIYYLTFKFDELN